MACVAAGIIVPLVPVVAVMANFAVELQSENKGVLLVLKSSDQWALGSMLSKQSGSFALSFE